MKMVVECKVWLFTGGWIQGFVSYTWRTCKAFVSVVSLFSELRWFSILNLKFDGVLST